MANETKPTTKPLSDTLSALLYRESEIQNAAKKISKTLDPLSSETQRAVLDLLNRAYTAQNPPKATINAGMVIK